MKQKTYAIILLLLLPLLVGWKTSDMVEVLMKEIGFKLKKKEAITIPFSNRVETRYTFFHRLHQYTTIRDYNNGFIEIQSRYRSKEKDENTWNLTVKRTVEIGSFRNTIYRIFVLGDAR
jgi:hypothetical protein